MLWCIFLHAAVSISAALLSSFLNLPAFYLQGLHTYIHPDSIPADEDKPKALLRRPDGVVSSSPDPMRRPRSKVSRFAFDECKAQLFRLRLTDSHIATRVFFPSYSSSFLSTFISLSNIAVCLLIPSSDPFVPILFAAVLISATHLLISLLNTTIDRPSSRHSERRLSLLLAPIGFISTIIFHTYLSPTLFDSRIPSSFSTFAACLTGILAWVLFIPTARSARSFWLGTDQLRWNLSNVSCGTLGRVLLYASAISSFVSPLLWLKHFALGEDWRALALAAAAVSQLLSLRSNVQMYLNEAVLCWYQRLHSSRVPDMDYGRAKVFLHNHYVCLAVIQFFALPVMVLLLLGLSQMRGNLFGGSIPFTGMLISYSDILKEMALFIAWWIMFARSILMLLLLGFYRCGLIYVS